MRRLLRAVLTPLTLLAIACGAGDPSTPLREVGPCDAPVEALVRRHGGPVFNEHGAELRPAGYWLRCYLLHSNPPVPEFSMCPT